MNVLAFDTCFAALGVPWALALGTPGARMLSRFEPMATATPNG